MYPYLCNMRIKQPAICGVYCIQNLVDGKKYIGSSFDCKGRIKGHFSALRNKRHGSTYLQAAFDKYGKENFEAEILEITPEDVVRKTEEKWILHYNTTNRAKGYNMLLPSQEVPRIPDWGERKKRWRDKNPPKNLKIITAEEWIEKRSENPDFTITAWKKENKIPGVSIGRKKVVGYSADGVAVQSYASIAEAHKWGGGRLEPLRLCLKMNSLRIKLCSWKGLYWFFEKDFNKYWLLSCLLKTPARLYGYEAKRRNARVKKKTTPVIKETSIKFQNIASGEVKLFSTYSGVARFLGVAKTRIFALKRGYRNKGDGKGLKPVHSIKGWCFQKEL
jgi:group I intron endonuclease